MTIEEKRYLSECVYHMARKAITEQKQINEVETTDSNNNFSTQKEDKKEQERRNEVLTWLKNDMINDAELMRQLWRPSDSDEEDILRSYFSKCKRGTRNFTTKDITTLHKILNQEL